MSESRHRKVDRQELLRRREREKADGLFLAYRNMGTGRTIVALTGLCNQIGFKIAKSTIARYSIKYEWQRKLLELESFDAERREKDVAKIVDDMNRQDAAMAQGMKGLVVGAIRYHQDRMRKLAERRRQRGEEAQPMLDMPYHDLANMARTAQQIERLARGQATSRTEIWVDIAQTVVREFVLIFIAINDIEDKSVRKQEFTRLGDEMMRRYYSETTKQQLEAEN